MKRINHNLLPKKDFFKRVLRYTVAAIVLLAFSLLIGTIGYHIVADLNWIDSFYNSAMILTGMGPVAVMETNAAKLFASFYAIFSGVLFLTTAAVFFAPFAHRLMHLLHVDSPDDKDIL